MILVIVEHSKIVVDYLQKVAKEVLEDIHHQPLEGTRSITQPKWHHVESKHPPLCCEHGLQQITCPNGHLVITQESIQETIHLLPSYVVRDDVSKRKGKKILLCNYV